MWVCRVGMKRENDCNCLTIPVFELISKSCNQDRPVQKCTMPSLKTRLRKEVARLATRCTVVGSNVECRSSSSSALKESVQRKIPMPERELGTDVGFRYGAIKADGSTKTGYREAKIGINFFRRLESFLHYDGLAVLGARMP